MPPLEPLRIRQRASSQCRWWRLEAEALLSKLVHKVKVPLMIDSTDEAVVAEAVAEEAVAVAVVAEAVVEETAVGAVETPEAEAPAPRPERRDRQDRREPRENRGERNNDRNKERGGQRDRGGDNRNAARPAPRGAAGDKFARGPKQFGAGNFKPHGAGKAQPSAAAHAC